MNIDVPISQASKNIHATITVTGMRRWNWRMRLCVWFLHLAAWVAPIDVDVEVNP